jgi:hypothetical protein
MLRQDHMKEPSINELLALSAGQGTSGLSSDLRAGLFSTQPGRCTSRCFRDESYSGSALFSSCRAFTLDSTRARNSGCVR